MRGQQKAAFRAGPGGQEPVEAPVCRASLRPDRRNVTDLSRAGTGPGRYDGSWCAGKSGRQCPTRPLPEEPEREPCPEPRPQIPRRLFSRGTWSETERVGNVLRKETVGGALLLVATVLALTWANSPWTDTYTSLRDTEIGPHSLHLYLSLGQWAADGLLAIFFFVAGLELKREFVAGDLRDPAAQPCRWPRRSGAWSCPRSCS